MQEREPVENYNFALEIRDEELLNLPKHAGAHSPWSHQSSALLCKRWQEETLNSLMQVGCKQQ